MNSSTSANRWMATGIAFMGLLLTAPSSPSTTAAPPSVAFRGATATDSAKLVQRVRDRLFDFVMTWRYDWKLDEVDRHPSVRCAKTVIYAKALDQVRQGLCRAPSVWIPEIRLPPRLSLPATLCRKREALLAPGVRTSGGGVEKTEASTHQLGVFPDFECLTWQYPLDTAPPYQLLPENPESEADQLDFGLSIDLRQTIHKLRAPVLALLDSAAAILPGDGFIAGQRVRFYMNDGSFTRAEAAARQCQAARWWCTALIGYAQYGSKQFAKSSDSFDAAVTAMPDSIRCEWTDAARLLPYEARIQYEAQSCQRRENTNARLWWLADPLYLEPGNERKTEQLVRQTIVALGKALEVDERTDWREQFGGPAATDMYLRYGVPSSWLWRDPPIAAEIKAVGVEPIPWRRGDSRSLPNKSGGHPQYPGPQYHTIPAWRAITDPLAAADSDWDLAPPRDSDGVWDYSWWPVEFYPRAKGPLLPLPHQIGFLRRDKSAMLASQVQWDSAWMTTGPPPSALVGLALSTSPTDLRTTANQMDGRTPRAMLTAVPSQRALLGLEMISSDGPAARTRFGISPPPPLSQLTPGTLAISDPLLVRDQPGEDAPTNGITAVSRMYGTTRLKNPTRICLYWEVYGLGDGDTIDVALRVVRHDSQNALQRLGAVLGLGRAGDDSLVVRWREPRSGDPGVFREGNIPVHPHGMVLDISQLTGGAYSLDISVARAGTSPGTAHRDFSIERM